MKSYLRSLSVSVIVIMSLSVVMGCATAPLGPSMMVMPAPNKPLDLFQQEVVDCKAWAINQMGGEQAVEDAQKRVATRAIIGTLAGAALGSVLGAGVGNAARGAAIGAGTGAAIGAASGNASAATSTFQLQRLYDAAYIQCMYAKGNQVPGQQQQVQRAQSAPAPVQQVPQDLQQQSPQELPQEEPMNGPPSL